MMMTMLLNKCYQTSHTSKNWGCLMGRKTCHQTSHTSTNSLWEWEEKDIIIYNIPLKNWWLEWEETHVIKHHIPLQIDDGNGQKNKLSSITFLRKMVMGMLRNRCNQTSHKSTHRWCEWDKTRHQTSHTFKDWWWD